MPLHFVTPLVILGIAILGYILGRRKAIRSNDGKTIGLHSLPSYYGTFVVLLTAVPALALYLIWSAAQPEIINARVSSQFSAATQIEGSELGLTMSTVRAVAEGLDILVSDGALTNADIQSYVTVDPEGRELSGLLNDAGTALATDLTPEMVKAANSYRMRMTEWSLIKTVVTIGLALIGMFWALHHINHEFRARNRVERVIRWLLIFAASIAILTTIGIVLSMLTNTIRFFQLYPATEFFFGTHWAPNFRGNSELSILPLLWGTLYISFVALLVAVPIGLFAAIYLAEYAGPKLRSFAKPLLEILAGIPTIVYGLFALLTIGPMLLNLFGDDGAGWMSAVRSVMTAGLVMGLMLIPFVSSLSDDIINAVPQALRDGSYGLGATKSETIRKVILPTALPGIVGAILLAASRAIGETMIVVLGAGAVAAQFDRGPSSFLNPFEAMTTITTRIVSQLTGDGEFNSPETLVAFALGLTLFAITLCLNIIALAVVRRYQEQYD